MNCFKDISCYMSGSNIFGQWSWCDFVTNVSLQDLGDSMKQVKLLQINWSYNILQIANNFYVSGAWCGKNNELVKVPLPDHISIEDLLIIGNDYKLILVSKSTNSIWIIDLNTENKMKKINSNILELIEDVEKRKKSDMNISKVVLVNDSCLYLTSTGEVYNGIMCPNYVDTKHCRGQICDIQCGYEHYILLTDTGSVYTWGNGRRLQLGHGDINNLESPTEVEALAGIRIKKVRCGGWHSLAISESGDLYAWGWNCSGQLGIKSEGDTLESYTVPTLVELFNSNGEEVTLSVRDIACGSRHSALLLEDNSVWATGYNKYGQCACSEGQYPTINSFKKVFDCDSNYTLMCGPWTTVLVKE